MKHDPNGPVDDFDDETWAHPSLDDQVGSKVKDPSEPDTSLPSSPDSTRLLTGVERGSSEQQPGPTQASMDSNEWDDSTPPVIEKGREIFGKYRLIELLGEGGMGQVWLVNNMALECNRALKLIWPNIAKNNNGWKRFNREAQLMAKLNHSNAVAVYDFKRIQSMGYIEMEYVRGKSLDKVLEERKGQPMPLEWIVQILDQLCAVLQEAHGHIDENTNKPKPIIHRDLKPSNLMLIDTRPEGQNLKVLDYGIAKMVDDEETQNNQLTNVGEYLGTIGYSSPEQIRGGSKVGDSNSHYEIDGRSDIYSVGVLLYQFLTGTLPFKGSSMAVLAAHLTQTPPSMSAAESKPRVPAEVERIVMQCLAKDPNLRPQTAHELAVKFRAAASLAKPAPKTDSRRFVLACVGLAILAAAVIFVYWKNSQGTKLEKATGDNSVVPDTIVKPAPPRKRPTPGEVVKLWIPEGYKAVDPNSYVPGTTNQAKRLRRVADGVEFDRFKDGVYLPVGYIPERDDDLLGDWPRVIIRKKDKEDKAKDPNDWVRFIRIKGKTFRCGDPRMPPDDKEAKPRWVKIPDFYIQETEATNGLIEEFLGVYPKDIDALSFYRRAYKLEEARDPKHILRIAATSISYPTALKCAQYLQGRLPTEDEWEYVARSGDEDFQWPWGKEIKGDVRGYAYVFNDSIGGAVVVKKYPKDMTEQKVYDMAGNLRERCLDVFKPLDQFVPEDNAEDHPMVVDPSQVAPAVNELPPKTEVSVRGGSWLTTAEAARGFTRDSEGFEEMIVDLGFRVLIECPPQPPPPVRSE